MQIIDKNKDYYDYYSYIYGIDKAITFDRRGSVIISNETIYQMIDRHFFEDSKESHFILLEIGDVQYLIKVSNIKTKKNRFTGFDEFKDFDLSIAHIYNQNKKYYNSVISIVPVRVKSTFSFGRGFEHKYIISDNFNDTVIKVLKERLIKLPILKDTKITSIIEGEKIWQIIDNYISSCNSEKDVDIEMTDEERAETHGFDRKYSFRHPIK